MGKHVSSLMKYDTIKKESAALSKSKLTIATCNGVRINALGVAVMCQDNNKGEHKATHMAHDGRRRMVTWGRHRA